MLLKIAKHCIPEYIKNNKLDELFMITAGAFECEAPELESLSFAERLHEYAGFTKEQAEKCLQSEGAPDERKRRIDAVEEQLYANSLIFGQDLRKSFHIKTPEQAIEALELIYRIIGIDFKICSSDGLAYGGPDSSDCGKPDEFTVSKCYFSSFYSAEVCRLISSLDQGLAAGLTGGGKLAFTQRITEGCGCCKGGLS